jgi:hypothetical protein
MTSDSISKLLVGGCVVALAIAGIGGGCGGKDKNAGTTPEETSMPAEGDNIPASDLVDADTGTGTMIDAGGGSTIP